MLLCLCRVFCKILIENPAGRERVLNSFITVGFKNNKNVDLSISFILFCIKMKF